MSMTAEEARRRLKAQQARELLKAEQGGGVTTTITGEKFENLTPEMVRAQQEEADLSWYDRPRQLAQGATLGLSDEIEAGIRAPFSDKGFSEIRGGIKGDMEDYASKNPGEALALELAGGLTTGGVGLSRTAAASGGKRAMQQALKRMEARQASRAPALNVLEDTTRMGPSLGRTLGVMGTEGAIAGAGYAEGDAVDRLQGAGLGAATGVGVGSALRGAKRGFETLSKRRLAQTVGEGDNYVPSTLADPGGIKRDFMQNVVGRSMGGGAKLLRQASRWAAGPARKSLQAGEKLKNFPNVARGETASARRQAEVARRQFEDAEMGRIDQAQGRRMGEIESMPDNAPDPVSLRKAAAEKAINPNMPPKSKAVVRAGSPQQAADELDSWWSKNGFNIVKKRTFGIDDKMRKELTQMADADPDLADVIGKMGLGRKKIKGDRLMELRNTFARPSNRTSDRWAAGKLRRMKTKVDGLIENSLDEAEKAAYKKELTAWGDKELFIEAVKNAGGKRQGNFDFDDWMTALGRYGRQRTYGKGTLQKAAEKGQTDTLAAKNARTAAMKADKEAARLGFKRDRKDVTRKAGDQVKRRVRAAEVRRGLPRRKAQLETTRDANKAQAQGVAALSPPSESTGLSQMLTAQVLSPNLGDRNLLTKVMSGTGISSGLASEGVGRLMAGQTGYQEALAKLLRENPELIEAMIRGTSRTAAGNAGEN